MTNDDRAEILRACIDCRRRSLSRAGCSMLMVMREIAPASEVDEVVDACYTFLDTLLKPEVVVG